MNNLRTIIVYRDTLLPRSETFIRGQAESLDLFKANYACLRRTAGTTVPEERVHMLCPNGIVGKLERIRFKLFGPKARQKYLLGRLNPLLMHAHFAPDGADVMSLANALRVPLVVSLHGYDVNSVDDNLPQRYLRRRERLKANAARFLCVSEFMHRQALARGFPADRSLVHYTGIDTKFFCPDPAARPRLPIVLFVGRLTPAKGCEYLIRAMTRVQETLPEVKLVLIGDGALRQHLEELANVHLRSFEFLGAQPPEVVRIWMNRATVFSVPCCITANDQEGFGMVFAEAQAMGLPVVSCSIGGIPEAVSNEETGFLVPERDSEALVPKLLLLLQNSELRVKFSNAGRVRADKLFNIRKQSPRLEQIYETVLMEWRMKADFKGCRDLT